jgi:transposase
MVRVEILNGVERRRRWSDADKRRIVEETLGPDAVIADVARRNGAATSLVFAWRRQARENGTLAPVEAPGSVSTLETHVAGPGLSCESLPAFIPMTIALDSRERLAAPSASAAIAISFGLNISMKIEGAPDTGTLAHVLNVLSTSAARR